MIMCKIHQNMKNGILFILLILVLCLDKANAQDKKAELPESIQKLMEEADAESTPVDQKFQDYIKLAKQLLNKDRNLSKEYSNKALELAINRDKPIWKAMSYNNQAVAMMYEGKFAECDSVLNLTSKTLETFDGDDTLVRAQMCINRGNMLLYTGQLDSSLVYFDKAIHLCEPAGYKEDQAKALTNKASVYLYKAQYQTSLINYFSALKVCESINDSNSMVMALGNISNIYQLTEQYRKAIDYGIKAARIGNSIGNKYAESAALMTVGGSYERMDILDSAMLYGLKAEKIKNELGDPVGIAIASYNLGAVLIKQGKYAQAEERIEKALATFEQLKSAEGIAFCKASLGRVYTNTGRQAQGVKLLEEAISIAKSNNLISALKDIYFEGALAYQDVGQFKLALENTLLHIELSDSLRLASNLQALDELQTIYQTEKQQNQIETLEKDQKLKSLELDKNKAELEQERLESERQKQQNFLLYGGLAIALIFGGFIFNRFRVTKKQRDIIEKQKSVVESQKTLVEEQKAKVDAAYEQLEEKNTEILDSINYAKRIQSAILPPNKLVKEYLKDSFVLYKPKDIVAGDFYWMEPHENGVLFAAADCTGHGVPGAMVSVVCNNGLNRSVREHGLKDPGQILDKTREIVISEFEKSEEEVKDGMDIALCSLEGNMLKYAGAHNPLWIIRSGAEDVEEIKANKQPIGKYDEPTPYETHTIELNTGDTFYTFSDGYADQFGGEKGKKLKAKNFKNLLLSIQKETMERQRELIDEAFETWKGDFEQLDDVCVIGVRV